MKNIQGNKRNFINNKSNPVIILYSLLKIDKSNVIIIDVKKQKQKQKQKQKKKKKKHKQQNMQTKKYFNYDIIYLL